MSRWKSRMLHLSPLAGRGRRAQARRVRGSFRMRGANVVKTVEGTTPPGKFH